MFETILTAIASLIDGILGIFWLGAATEKHLSESSVVGESKFDAETRRWHERILDSWWLISLGISLFLGGAGYVVWTTFFER